MIGERVGSYLLQRELGSGGMGTVYEARRADGAAGDDAPERVAVKLIHPHLVARGAMLERFRREAEIGRRVVHPNVVRTLDVGGLDPDDLRPYVVLELVTGQTLAELRDEMGLVSEDLCRHVAAEITKGLGALHAAGVVHRDLKPGNVLITPDNVVKVMDLGLARQVSGEDRLSRTGQFVGTAYYAPPEQFRGEQQVDPRSDLYALGVLLYELSTGAPPFSGDSLEAVMRSVLQDAPRAPRELCDRLGPFFESLVLALLAKDPAARPPSAEALDEILRTAEDGAWWRDVGSRRVKRPAAVRPRVEVARDAPVVGRDDVLAELLEMATSGEGHAVLVEGEAGIGKSRLVDALIDRLGDSATVLYGAYAPGGAATESGALTNAFREHLGAGRVQEECARLLDSRPGLATQLAAQLRGDAVSAERSAMSVDAQKSAFLALLQALGRERPTVLVVDDLPFAPREGRDIFAALAHGVRGHPVLLIGTARPGLPAEWVADVTRPAHVRRVALGRLTDADVEALCEHVLGPSPDARAVAGHVRDTVGGNPFFLFEMLRALREEGVLAQRDDGSWRTTTHGGSVVLPEGVRDLLGSRLRRVADEDRALLECAACCGVRFDARLVAEAVGVGRIPALRALDRLEREHGLVRSDEARFVFDHHALRAAVYDELHPSLREAYHAALGDALETLEGVDAESADDVAGPLALDLCRHLLRGGSPRRATPYLRGALASLDKSCRYTDAAELAHLALDADGGPAGDDRLFVLLRAYDFDRQCGRPERLDALLDEALAVATELGTVVARAKVNVTFGIHMLSQGHTDLARDHLQEAVAAAVEAGEKRIEMSANGNLGAAHLELAEYEEARACYRRWLELAQELGDRRAEASAVGEVAAAWLQQGRLEEAEPLYERQLALSREIGFKHGESSAVGNLGRVSMDRGDMEPARARFREQARLAREMGDRRGEIAAEGNQSVILMETGRYEEALPIVARLVEMSRDIGSRGFEAVGIGNLGTVTFFLGRYAESERWHREHRTLAREIGDVAGEMLATGNLGVLAFVQGRYDRARELHEERLALARRLDDDRNVATALLDIASAAEAAGDNAEAERRCREALAAYRRMGRSRDLSRVLTLLGGLVSYDGRDEEARELLLESVEVARDADSIDMLARAQLCLVQLGAADVAVLRETLDASADRIGHRNLLEIRYELWELNGDRDDLAEAHRLLQELLAAAGPERRAALADSVAVHRKILAAWQDLEGDSEAETVVAD